MLKTITKEQFLHEVIAEIEHIKTQATQEELDCLNFATFLHHRSSECIYGQMTGSCTSVRAQQLYSKIYDRIRDFDPSGHDTFVPFHKQGFNHGIFFTPLEKYLYMTKRTVHEHIIDYLKGECLQLDLSETI